MTDASSFSPLACRLVHGPHDSYFEGILGKSVASIRRALAGVYSIPDDAEAYCNGSAVAAEYALRAGDSVEFLVRRGRKGANALPVPDGGRLLTVKEAAAELYCSISFVYKLMRSGQLAFERRGRRKLPLAVSVAEYRQRSRCQATAQASRPGRSPRQPYQFQRLFREKPSRRGR
jgi:excisionase family DNA binding protein